MALTTASVGVIHLEEIRGVLRTPGPCITVLMPPHHPGEPTGSSPALLKSNLREISKQFLAAGGTESACSDLIAPLAELAEDPVFSSGSHWPQAIFRSPTSFERFFLTQPVAPLFRLGGSFSIRHLAGELACPRTFHVLAVSKEKVGVIRCEGLDTEIISPPADVPATLAEALKFEPPDHDLENRSSAGSSTGSMKRVRFGTGSEREAQAVHLADYYKLVDRGLTPFLQRTDRPLLLAGVGEDTAIFHAVSTYPRLAARSVAGSFDLNRSLGEIADRAYRTLQAESLEAERAALVAALENSAPARVSTDLDVILRAAFEGRVGKLYLDKQAEHIGFCAREGYWSSSPEDLLNVAAARTLVHDGAVFELPTAMMPGGASIIAILRWS